MVDYTGWAGWAPGVVDMRCGLDGVVQVCPTIAWVKGPFALDFRPICPEVWDRLSEDTPPCAWVLTHIPTGYAIGAMATHAGRAQMLADEVAKLADFSAMTVESSVFLTARMHEFFERHSEFVCNARDTIAPWMVWA